MVHLWQTVEQGSEPGLLAEPLGSQRSRWAREDATIRVTVLCCSYSEVDL